MLFTAQDKSRRLLTDLKQQDIRLIEDGQPQEITYFGKQVDLPLSLAILIDTSASQERTLPEEKDAAKSFIQSVIRPAKDEVSIVSFTGETTLEQGMTNNVGRLSRAVDRVQFVPPSGYIGGGVVAGGTPPISGIKSSDAGFDGDLGRDLGYVRRSFETFARQNAPRDYFADRRRKYLRLEKT